MRIAIVNAEPAACGAIGRVLEETPGLVVAWTAQDGLAAVERARGDPPDLILMDLVLPKLDGVEAIRRIMAERPCPILVVTATVRGRIDRVYEAMARGAVDAVDTPVVTASGSIEGAAILRSKVATAAKLVGRPPRMPAPAEPLPYLVVVGASTGGPAALTALLTALPADPRLSVVIVQHMDVGFFSGLATLLGARSRLPVELVVPGQRPKPGTAWLADTCDHLHMEREGRLSYTAEPRSACFRPSVDVFFHSVADHWPETGVAVLLTGMQRDGAEGMLRLRRRGWHTIAQDEATSVVWGMPRAAVELGAAVEVLPLPRIAAAIVEHAQASGNK